MSNYIILPHTLDSNFSAMVNFLHNVNKFSVALILLHKMIAAEQKLANNDINFCGLNVTKYKTGGSLGKDLFIAYGPQASGKSCNDNESQRPIPKVLKEFAYNCSDLISIQIDNYIKSIAKAQGITNLTQETYKVSIQF